jgi:hypothetical protein
MIRFLLGLPIVLVLLVLAGLYTAYGEVEPCRALAVERAQRADIHLPFAESGIEAFSRLQTSQMSSGECARDLLKSWEARLKTHWK